MEKKFIYRGCNVKVIYKKIKHTYMRVVNKEVVITTSLLTKQGYLEDLIEKNFEKIEKMLLIEENSNKIYYKGVAYEKVKMNGVQIDFCDNKVFYDNEKNLIRWYQKKVYDYLIILLEEEYERFDEKFKYPELKIRKMKTRWGVCNRGKNKITLNSELMRFSDGVIRYVIIHELAHFVFLNHNQKFWRLVEKYYPDYKSARKKLRKE